MSKFGQAWRRAEIIGACVSGLMMTLGWYVQSAMPTGCSYEGELLFWVSCSNGIPGWLQYLMTVGVYFTWAVIFVPFTVPTLIMSGSGYGYAGLLWVAILLLGICFLVRQLARIWKWLGSRAIDLADRYYRP